jgi:hypothetical protein
MLAQHDYWSRAWITQEIAHAKHLSLLATDVELDQRLLEIIAQISGYAQETLYAAFLCHINIACGHRQLHGKPLVALLHELSNQKCHTLRDQVHSLLGFAAEGTNIHVDYDKSS